MIRICLALIALAVVTGNVFAQGKGAASETTVAFGWVRQPDGTKKNIAGTKLRLAVEKISAKPKGIDLGMGTDTLAYLNDNGESSYFMSDPAKLPMPSALDDVRLSAGGAGTLWQSIAFGMWVPRRERVLIRMQVWDTFVAGRGAGVSAFDGEIADFGFHVDSRNTVVYPNMPWNYRVTVSGFAGQGVFISVADGECNLAIQFRAENQPDGPFADQWEMLFSGGGVGVGASDDLFYFDTEPFPDGIYDETEFDFFGGPPNEANFLLRIETGGSALELLPTAATTTIGRYRFGNFSDLWFSDDTYYNADSYNPALEVDFPIRVVIESTAPPGTLIGLKFSLESHASQSIIFQQIFMFNFVLNRWELHKQSIIGNLDSINEAVITSNFQQYVRASDRKMLAYVQVKELASESALWDLSLDKASWTVIR